MDRIKIDLLDWESAACAIYTANVDLATAEIELYSAMRAKWGYDDNDINKFLNNADDDNDDYNAREKFLSRLCEEEELAVMRNGGIYYEDMSDEEYNRIFAEVVNG
jgi:hypothetical protein